MAFPRLTSFPIRTWATLLLVGLGGFLLWRDLADHREIRRVVLIAPRESPFGPGLETLVSDHLEVLAGVTVIHAQTLPGAADLEKLPANTLLLRFHGRREGEQLALTSAWTTAARLKAGGPWDSEDLPLLEPSQAMRAWVKHWPLRPSHRGEEQLLPRNARNFWSLLEGMSIQEDLAATEHLAASQRLAEEEPQCAAAWVTLGDHLYRSLWVNPDLAGIGLSSRTDKSFLRAMELIPGYPRAVFLRSMMLTDTGNQATALQSLHVAARMRPNVPDLYLGFAYAGRTVGLLAGAKLALDRRNTVLGPLATPSLWSTETTYLYLGEWDEFGKELDRVRAVRTDANVLFYQGYFALLQGKRDQALAFMKAGSQPGETYVPFRDLCKVYRAYLEGRPADGMAELRRMDEIRGKLRIPDGEWTFKEAEAYSLLGDSDRAMDAATRAFVQGYSCARWYESSPFLEKARTHRRWAMLRRNVLERQAVLETTFPPTLFAP